MVEGDFLEDSDGSRGAYTLVGHSVLVEPATLALWDVGVDGDQFTGLITFPDGPSTDDGMTPFSELVPLGTRWRHGDAQLPVSARHYAFILGGPAALDGATVEFLGTDGLIESREVTVEPHVMTRPVVVSRTEAGAETIERVETWPAGRLSFLRPPGAHAFIIRDVWGNHIRFQWPNQSSD